MSHLAPQAAIFSPSIARAAASTAKDWAYVDAWLRRQYASAGHDDDDDENAPGVVGRTPPSFERNPATLEALLALVAANEEADEERDRLAGLEAAALDEVRAAEEEKAERRRRCQQERRRGDGNDDGGDDDDVNALIHGDLLAEDLLEAIDAGLSKDGLAALDAMADVSLSLGTGIETGTGTGTGPAPSSLSPAGLAHRFVEQQGRAHETEHLLHRVRLLQAHLDGESARLSAFLEELRLSPQYRLPDDVTDDAPSIVGKKKEAKEKGKEEEEEEVKKIMTAEANARLERAVRDAAAGLPELRRHVEALEKKVGVPSPTVDDVRRDEDAYLDLLSRKKDLDAQVRAFAGLPPDVEAARVELEGLRAQLREATEKRDANFELLVERESPVKVRTSRRF